MYEEKTLMEAVWQLNDKVDALLNDVSELKTDMSRVKADVSELKADMVEVRSDVSELKTDMVEVKADISELKSDVSELKTDMVKVKSDISRLESLELEVKALHFDVVELRLTCENDLNRQIRMIAEGHGDLLRHFDRALERKAEMEEYAIRVIYLEGEVRRLKRYWDESRIA